MQGNVFALSRLIYLCQQLQEGDLKEWNNEDAIEVVQCQRQTISFVLADLQLCEYNFYR